jgi:hypothetical protein
MNKFAEILRGTEGTGDEIEKEFVDNENRRWYRKDDYRYIADQEKFYNIVTRSMHTKESVNASISKNTWTVVVAEDEDEDEDEPKKRKRGRPKNKVKRIPPSEEIKVDNYTEGMAWLPGAELIVPNLVVGASGEFTVEKASCVNMYTPPPQWKDGDPAQADRWIKHVEKICNDEGKPEDKKIMSKRFFDVLAHALQFPGEKCNGAIVLSGNQGVGKDAALYPIRPIFGNWNVANIEPDSLHSTFKPFFRSIIVIVDETHSNEEMKTTDFYNTLKPMLASPPDYLPMNDKFQPIRYVKNVMRFFITTNDKLSLFIPEGDRRMFVIDCYLKSNWHMEKEPDYFINLFDWFHNQNGLAHIAAWLRARDLSKFNPKEHPADTEGKTAILSSWSEPEDAFANALHELAIDLANEIAKAPKEQPPDSPPGVIHVDFAKKPEGDAAMPYPDIVFGQELLYKNVDDEMFYADVRALMRAQRRLDSRMARSGYASSVTNPAGDRWSFTPPDGKPFRSKTAYVKKTKYEEWMLAGGKDLVLDKIRKQGYKCAEKYKAFSSEVKSKRGPRGS